MALLEYLSGPTNRERTTPFQLSMNTYSICLQLSSISGAFFCIRNICCIKTKVYAGSFLGRALETTNENLCLPSAIISQSNFTGKIFIKTQNKNQSNQQNSALNVCTFCRNKTEITKYEYHKD